MIAFVNGIFEYLDEDCAVIDMNGVGMNIKISPTTASNLPPSGEPVTLYTYTSVREDAIWLYGFLSRSELALFKKIISVNGIGPKSAQAILGAMDVDSFRYAIISQDKKTLSKLPGIGAKTAERLILELREKLSGEANDLMLPNTDLSPENQTSNLPSAKKDTIDALVALGYSKTQCLKALESIENADTIDSGTLLKMVLKRM